MKVNIQLSRSEFLQRLACLSTLPLLGTACSTAAKNVDSSSTVGIDSVTGWATGGTAAMTDKANYPSPFMEPSECNLLAKATLGPCTTSEPLIREDISEGWDGLPLRLGLKLVDSDCQPIADAVVRIWHTNLEGSYSGETPRNDFCLLDQDYASENFARGTQLSNANGEVFFDTCFPGWYPGRAIHIHIQVLINDQSICESQLFFPEETIQEIFSDHPAYQQFGQPDTSFQQDFFSSDVDASQWERHIVSVAQMSDGVMLSGKVIAIL